MLDLVHMGDFARRRVTDLSGGEQQRIALARALAPGPKLLMLDEPLGALDRTLKQALLEDLREVIHTARIPVIYVTHDQEEAFSIADRLILLNSGRIEQTGSPEEVYHQPASLWTANFLGLGNIISGTVTSSRPVIASTTLGEIRIPSCEKSFIAGDAINLLLLPAVEGLLISSAEEPPVKNLDRIQFSGTVEGTIFLEGKFKHTIMAGGTTLNFISGSRFAAGQNVIISYPLNEVRCL